MTRFALAGKCGALAASGRAERSGFGRLAASPAAPAARDRRASRSIIARLPKPSVARCNICRRVMNVMVGQIRFGLVPPEVRKTFLTLRRQIIGPVQILPSPGTPGEGRVRM